MLAREEEVDVEVMENSWVVCDLSWVVCGNSSAGETARRLRSGARPEGRPYLRHAAS